MANQNLTLSLDEKDYNRIQSALSNLSRIERNAIVQRGLQEGVILFVKQGRINLRNTLSTEPQNVRMRKGNLIRSFTTRIKKLKGKGYAGFNSKGHHAHLVNDGTKKRWTKKGAYRGSVSKNSPMKGSNFWRNAFEIQKENAAKELMNSIRISINKIVGRN